VLKVVLKALMLKENDLDMVVVDTRLEGLPQNKPQPRELNT